MVIRLALLLIAKGLAADSFVPCAVTGKGYKGAATASTPNGAWVQNAAKCQNACAGMTTFCNFFVWYPVSTACWLVGHEADLVPDEKAVSGPRECAQDVYGNDMAQVAAAKLNKMALFLEKRMPWDKHAVAAAREVEADIAKGAKIPVTDTLTVVNSVASVVTAEEAAREGILIDRDDLDNLIVPGAKYADMGGIWGNQNPMTGHGGNPENWAGLHEGDMAFLRGAEGQSFGSGQPWTDAKVSYCFDQSCAPLSQHAFEIAINEVKKAVPGISFENVGYGGSGRCTVAPAIFVQSTVMACYADMGMHHVGFPGEANQVLNLASPGCDDVGTALHEVLHALGMNHEQSRPDRDTYIAVHQGNIQDGKHSQFDIDGTADAARPYDILSLMHYGPREFSRDPSRLETITVKTAGYQVHTSNPHEYRLYQPGQRLGMSVYDIAQLADLYGCDVPMTTCNPPTTMRLFYIVLLVAGGLCAVSVLAYVVCFCCCRSPSKAQYGRMPPQDFRSAFPPGQQFRGPARGPPMRGPPQFR